MEHTQLAIIRPHRSTTYIDVDYCYKPQVALSVGLSVTVVSPVRTAEPIEMPFRIWTGWAQEARIRWGAHRRHLANTTEPSMCGADAVCCQITLTTCSSVVIMTLSCIVSRMQRDIGQALRFFLFHLYLGPQLRATVLDFHQDL